MSFYYAFIQHNARFINSSESSSFGGGLVRSCVCLCVFAARTASMQSAGYVAYVGTFAAMSERASAPPFSSSVMKVSRMSEAKAALVKLFF